MVVVEDIENEAYQNFLDFDWSDDRWQKYLESLYPPPNHKQILKFKKKWYKKSIDPDFDESYEPPAPEPTVNFTNSSSGSEGSTSYASAAPQPNFPSSPYADGTKWATMGPKATICFVAYSCSLIMAIGASAGAFPSYQALVVLVSAFVLEILAKYGLKFKTEYVHSVLLDDVGVMPIMSLTLLTPGLHPWIRMFALVPSSITALMSFAQISKAHAKLDQRIRDFFSPLAEAAARYQLMQVRADVEVALGFVLIGGVFTARAAPISALLFWNFMMMRYMMSSWTQATFRKIDKTLSPVLGNLPGISNGYSALKRGLYSFVNPESKRAGRLCPLL